MATSFHAQPIPSGPDAERFLDVLADLRASADHLEQYVHANPDVSRTGLSRLRTIAASARELAAYVAPPRASPSGVR